MRQFDALISSLHPLCLLFEFSACPLETKKKVKKKCTQCTWTEKLRLFPSFLSKIKVSSLHFLSLAQSKNQVAICNKTCLVHAPRKAMNQRIISKIPVSLFPAAERPPSNRSHHLFVRMA
jgi:hypothetical protein